jgi:hypothetical protein
MQERRGERSRADGRSHLVRGERGGGKACTFGSSRMQALSLKGEIAIAS